MDVFHSLATGIFRSADLDLETEELVKTDKVKKVDEEVERKIFGFTRRNYTVGV
jgi:hypothetical protein